MYVQISEHVTEELPRLRGYQLISSYFIDWVQVVKDPGWGGGAFR